ncbi:MAG TPA: nucleotidyltransferase domain-containing protein [Phycisphaerae bacterium]|nr:nucleotidyltransferase domain-containing protein [Phycisphaerae bacterium]
MGIDQELIDDIVRRLLTVARPRRIILFGSAASGRMTRDSDIDLLVLEDRPADPRKESVLLRGALRGMGYPFDVIVMDMERFEESKDVIGGIAFPASRSGKVIYEAA